MFILTFIHAGDQDARPFHWNGSAFVNAIDEKNPVAYKSKEDAEKDRDKAQKWCEANNARGSISVLAK